jgi:predicted transglutaminase-like cysteine proteinase
MQELFNSKRDGHLRLALIILTLAPLGACADVSMPTSTPMQLGSAAFAPRGFLQFCERRPDQCGLPSPLATEDRAKLDRDLNQLQWANVFNLKPVSIGRPPSSVVLAPLVEPSVVETPVTPTTLGQGLVAEASRDAMPALNNPANAVLTGVVGESVGQSSQPLPGFDLIKGAEDFSGLQPLDLGFMASVELASMPKAPSAPSSVVNAAPNMARSLVTTPRTMATVLHLTPLVWSALNGVNQSINSRIQPMTDEQAFGVSDYWTLPLSDGPRPVGNCKHYALEKRKALVDAGFSPDALSIAIVKTGWGEVHAVLIIGTDQGDYVLDNLTPWIKGWQESRYTWIERQTPGQPLRWANLAAISTKSPAES